MPIESEVQTDTIPELNEQWPLGTDPYSQGDNHIRLIKKILKATFPNLTTPITITAEQINRGSNPIGTVAAFYQAAAPVGWIRVPGIGVTYGVRIVGTADSGGVGGGSHDPILNDKVPGHIHGINIRSTNEGQHQHFINVKTDSQDTLHHHYIDGNTFDSTHSHAVNIISSSISEVANQGNIPSGGQGGNAVIGSGVSHNHLVSGNTEGNTHSHIFRAVTAQEETGHKHQVTYTTVETGWHMHSITGEVFGNPDSSNWTPRYLDFILCQRTS